jgi:mannose-1-phosphate guanylyltransferase/mannose-6-phosphate isomerase
MVPVILSGGAGTRLWPISRLLHPKQLVALTGEQTMIQETVARLNGLEDVAEPVIVCNAGHADPIRRQLAALRLEPRFIVEPVGRNTAPAAAAAALESGAGDSLLLVLPADHVITDVPSLHAAIRLGAPLAASGKLVTFGIVPDRPETGYGYIRRGAAVDDAYEIDRFVEKPDAATAERYVIDGSYYWNSGMFLFRADAYLGSLAAHAPGIEAAIRETVDHSTRTGDVLVLDENRLAACPSDSIDYAVMEHTDRGVVVPLDAGWSDVGSWTALWELTDRDEDANVVRGDVLLEDVHRSFIRADGRLVAVVGLDDVIVVETADAVLVSSKDRAQDVRLIVERLRAGDRVEVIRPSS